MKKVAISVGDLNGIGIELILRNHKTISNIVRPIYCIDEYMLAQACNKLNIILPNDFNILNPKSEYFNIESGEISKESGKYSFESFQIAVKLAQIKEVDAICTLPIHKKAWELAGIKYKGHTDALRDFCNADAIMMLGCPSLFVALYTEHIPLREVANSLTKERLTSFLINFANSIKSDKKVGILGLNPHAGDGGVLGNEEDIIYEAVLEAKKTSNIYDENILVPDIAFTPHMRAKYSHMVAMYHDQGLAPLKALYFDESINVSLNLPILRTSVDHGTAFDKAYKGVELNNLSYINAIKYIAEN